MKPLFVVFAFTSLLVMGCDNKVIPLQNTYQDKSYEFSVPSAKDKVWTELIDLFHTKGVAIKTIDKKEGVITTENTSFLNSYSWEDKNGGLTNPNAFVVCSKVRGTFTFPPSLKPDSVTGQLTVLLKEESDKTFVSIGLTNASGVVS